jgi:hypothetical protein
MVLLGEMTIEDAAKKAAGNWRRFDCFCWDRAREIDDSDSWSIIYTKHRDSGLLDQSNAAAIAKVMRVFADTEDPDVVFESHSHWAVGHINGFSVRVFRDGELTPAFVRYHELTISLADYPILDETDYSNREYEATLKNIVDAAWRLKRQFKLPDDWTSQVFGWFSDNDDRAIENRDDQGGYPSEDQLRAAFIALSFHRID